MKKTDAIKLFGKTQVSLAKALGITKSAVNQWPEELSLSRRDQVVGAAVRLGKVVPSECRAQQ